MQPFRASSRWQYLLFKRGLEVSCSESVLKTTHVSHDSSQLPVFPVSAGVSEAAMHKSHVHVCACVHKLMHHLMRGPSQARERAD